MEINKSAKNTLIVLRTASQEDVEFLKELRRASMWQVVTNHYLWIEEDQLERVMVDFECAQIICTDDQDIGMLKVVYGPKQVQLCQIQLLPKYRSRGIGSMLITKLQEGASASSVSISLNVFRSNPAIKLYTRLGFNISSENDNMFTMVWHPDKNITNREVETGL